MRENIDPRLGPDRLDHMYASEYVRLGHVAQVDFDDYFKFAIVRNPWERLVSEYKFIARPDVPFSDFLLRRFPVAGRSDRRRHVEPQWKFVYDARRNVVVDRIVRFERLADEMAEVFQRIFGEPVALPRINWSRDQRDYTSFYDAETRAFVEKFYRDDIELFRYSFD
jgi:hypothetical protein